MQLTLGQVVYGQGNQTLKYDTFLPYLHVDNPTNARIVLPNGQSVGPYTLNAVVTTPTSQGTFTVDTSDTSYPNVSIFSSAPITMYLTDEGSLSPGISYAPVADISNVVNITGTISGNVTVTNTVNATITNASIPVTQSGAWNISITNASIAVTQSGAWSVTVASGTINATITNATIAVTQSGTWNINITNATIAVTQSGTWNINATIQNATIAVTQSGTWNINATIQNATIAVTQSGTWNINANITNATITITGNVTFNNTQINVQNVPSTLLNVNQPQTALTDLTWAANSTSTQTTGAVPTGTHALAFLGDNAAGLTAATVKGHQSGRQYWPKDTVNVPSAAIHRNALIIVPVDSVHDTTFDVTGTNNPNASSLVIKVTAILDVEAIEVVNSGANPVYVAQSLIDGYPLWSVAVHPKNYDATGFSAPAVGTQATITLGPVTGTAYTCAFIDCSFGVSVAPGGPVAQDLEILDGATIIYQHEMRMQNIAGYSVSLSVSDLAYLGTVGNSMTLKFAGGQANCQERVNIGTFKNLLQNG